jgi:hypothetical protein
MTRREEPGHRRPVGGLQHSLVSRIGVFFEIDLQIHDVRAGRKAHCILDAWGPLGL